MSSNYPNFIYNNPYYILYANGKEVPDISDIENFASKCFPKSLNIHLLKSNGCVLLLTLSDPYNNSGHYDYMLIDENREIYLGLFIKCNLSNTKDCFEYLSQCMISKGHFCNSFKNIEFFYTIANRSDYDVPDISLQTIQYFSSYEKYKTIMQNIKLLNKITPDVKDVINNDQQLKISTNENNNEKLKKLENENNLMKEKLKDLENINDLMKKQLKDLKNENNSLKIKINQQTLKK